MLIQDKLRASSVKRWHIITTSRSQSLAEHSFNVAQISLAILDEMRCGMREYWGGKVAQIALDHDLHEIIEGDAPSTTKPTKDWEGFFAGVLTPEMIVKTADVLDAYVFLNDHKVGRHANQAFGWMEEQYLSMLRHTPLQLTSAVESVENQLVSGEFTI